MLILQKDYPIQTRKARIHREPHIESLDDTSNERKLPNVHRGGVYVMLRGGPCATPSRWISRFVESIQVREPSLPSAVRPALWYTYKRTANPYMNTLSQVNKG